MRDLKFDLEDDLSVSDLRKVDEWAPRLFESGKLRLQRRGEVIGVLLSPREWRAFKEQSERYQEALDNLEDAQDRQIIALRGGGRPVRGVELKTNIERELKKAGLV